jgi:hypothetical protein
MEPRSMSRLIPLAPYDMLEADDRKEVRMGENGI